MIFPPTYRNVCSITIHFTPSVLWKQEEERRQISIHPPLTLTHGSGDFLVHGDKRGASILKKGIVLELGEEFVTVLTPEREFSSIEKRKRKIAAKPTSTAI
ncbi:hypothetical protein A0V43_01995 [Geobacillus sp. JS12]|nr:hypothetical protein A0V43_01995 [Geobacillus sp. JS12]